ncbi:MarR family winged helix-turn-helix transcriptional regulator [Pigmentiphaga kullae]|uniref:DNA-binding MarR family transcriptional regulator n=1 Tax=Pigmentiphaga kullae TaxID=151784 RepID=A0A4Q7N7Z7_9BURK|nr:MarR family transcriptional regulator [Pigmentiphaga kullae]RZS78153.1 DNA-binding MarR family transcriptional regulator [Pigmentiphaga kullae]
MLDLTGNESIDLAAQLRPAILRLNRLLRRETQAFGVSPLMVMLLSTIDKEPGIGVNDLANRENMRAASMSSHVKQLEAAGYIQRDQTLHTDKRRVGLAVTPEGRRLVAEVRKRRTDWLAGRIAKLDPDDREALGRAARALQHLGE